MTTFGKGTKKNLSGLKKKTKKKQHFISPYWKHHSKFVRTIIYSDYTSGLFSQLVVQGGFQ
jgi:hypothetical protein